MTTIATDGKSMAGDSQVTGGGNRCASAVKVMRAPDGRVFGACGPSVDCIRFRTWMEAGGDQPTLSEDFSALILNVDGSLDWIDKNFVPVRNIVPFAIGSGSELAIGAMLAGAPPATAVGIACQRDTCSGGDITVESL